MPVKSGRQSLSFHDVLPLHMADITFPEWHPLRGQTGEVLAFALRHPTGLILFETGIGSGSELIDDLYEISRRDIEGALEAHGHGLDDVRLIVNSHLHFDHCGNNRAFRVSPSTCRGPNTRPRTSLTTPCRNGSTSTALSMPCSTAMDASRATSACCRRPVTQQVTNRWSSSKPIASQHHRMARLMSPTSSTGWWTATSLGTLESLRADIRPGSARIRSLNGRPEDTSARSCDTSASRR